MFSIQAPFVNGKLSQKTPLLQVVRNKRVHVYAWRSLWNTAHTGHFGPYPRYMHTRKAFRTCNPPSRARPSLAARLVAPVIASPMSSAQVAKPSRGEFGNGGNRSRSSRARCHERHSGLVRPRRDRSTPLSNSRSCLKSCCPARPYTNLDRYPIRRAVSCERYFPSMPPIPSRPDNLVRRRNSRTGKHAERRPIESQPDNKGTQ